MKKSIKRIWYITLFLVIAVCCFSVSPMVNVANAGESGGMDFKKADNFIAEGQKNVAIQDLSSIGKDFVDIGSILTFVGAGILVAGVGYLGIMYMISPPERQGKLKQQLVGLLVSGIVIFGAYSIWSILVNILGNTIDK